MILSVESTKRTRAQIEQETMTFDMGNSNFVDRGNSLAYISSLHVH